MNHWKPGDMALLVDNPTWVANRHFIGEIATILGPAVIVGDDWQVGVCGEKLNCQYPCLKPIPPDEEKASWEAIREITNWSPRELEHVFSN